MTYNRSIRKEDMIVNTEVKGTLAKLLATENLKVEHRKITTACFDVNNRVLILPIWKTASATVYDLLVGHEVGHALYTPNVDYEGAPKDFVNVLEDARIEKMMKRTYPGLRKSFFQGYRELWEKDFFGVKECNVDTLPLIDRINLYFKGNPGVNFSDDEKDFVTRAANTNTFEEVIALAKEIYGFAEEKQKEKEMDLPAPQTQDGPGEQQSEEVTPEGSDTTQDGGDTDEDPVGDDPADLNTPSYGIGGETFDETQSVTEEALREALETLVDDNAKEWVYLDLPKIKLDEYLVPWKTIHYSLEEHFTEYDSNGLQFTFDKCEEYKKSAQKSVNYLVKQFEMKKSADQYARTSMSKTGVLDTNKLHTYRYNEDIFKKVAVVPDGKNHGLVMLLDWSGSMANVLMDTLKQTYNLIWFCRKVGIAFRVYAFQSGYGSDVVRGGEDKTLHISDDFRLLEFFSSQMNAKTLDKQMRYVWAQAWGQNAYNVKPNPMYSLGGTPLAEATMCMRQAVKEMKRVENVQKVNVVALTDGEANPMSWVVGTYPEDHYRHGDVRCDYLCHHRNKVFILRDPETGYSRKISSSPYQTTSEIVSFYKEITDYNWIGIRLCSKSDLNRMLNEYVPFEMQDKYNKQWTKERFVALDGETGFNKQFFMPNNYIGNGTEDLEVKQKKEVATKAELTRAFKKHMGSKMTNKTILNAFIEQIA